MKAHWLAAGLLATTGVAAVPAESEADVRVGIGILLGHDHHRGRYADAYRFGYERGHHEGAEHGWRDGSRGKDFNFGHARDYRRAREGYRGWMGPRFEYEAGFRRGYEQGYRRSYSAGRYDRYGDHRDRDRYRGRDRYGDGDDRYIYEEPPSSDRYRRR